MPKFLAVTMIDLDAEAAAYRAQRPALALVEDELEQPIPTPEPTPATLPDSIYFPGMIDADEVREFYPRRGAAQGTRIVYKSGAARPVKEAFAEIAAKFASLNN